MVEHKSTMQLRLWLINYKVNNT